MPKQLEVGHQHWWFVDDTLFSGDVVTGAITTIGIAHPSFRSLRNLAIEDIQLAPEQAAILVLLHPAQAGYRTVGNFVRVSLHGEIDWWAELTDTGSDNYVQVSVLDREIVAFSWSGCRCRIDPSNGRIVQRQFVK